MNKIVKFDQNFPRIIKFETYKKLEIKICQKSFVKSKVQNVSKIRDIAHYNYIKIIHEKKFFFKIIKQNRKITTYKEIMKFTKKVTKIKICEKSPI